MDERRLNIAVGIATAGRRAVLSETINVLARQTRLPDLLVICPVTLDDVDAAALVHFPAPTHIVNGAAGLPAQRNLILAEIKAADVVIFFDDDFFPHPDYLLEVEHLLADNPDVVGATGFLVADGAHGPGISIEAGHALMSNMVKDCDTPPFELYGAYGCNMSFRLAPIRRHGILFDENLPLYGWQEDIDFSRRLAPSGKIIKSARLQGVHLGTKRGRTSGVRLGYSQVANPIYLCRKGTFAWMRTIRFITRNVVANIVRSVRPEPWVDRRGRLKGNLLAVSDMAIGRLSPRRILEL
jgi:GT2 family glycosyltransferase